MKIIDMNKKQVDLLLNFILRYYPDIDFKYDPVFGKLQLGKIIFTDTEDIYKELFTN